MIRRFGALVSLIFFFACDGKAPLVEATEVVRSDPAALDFGIVAVGQYRIFTASIRNDGRAPVSLEAIKVPPGFLVAPRTAEISPGASFPIHVTFQPEVVGLEEGTVRFASAKSGIAVSLSVAGVGVERVLEAPEQLDFGGVVVGKTASKSISLVNHTDASLVVRLQVDSPDFAVEVSQVEVAPLGTAEVELSFMPSARALSAGNLRLRPCPECGPVQVSLSGTGIENHLEVHPQNVDFGSVAPGLVGRRQVSVTNVGDGPISLSNPRLVPEVGGGFRVVRVDVGASLPVGDTGTIDLEYAPDIRGPSRASLILAEVDGTRLATVSLQGDGEGPLLTISPVEVDFGTQPQGRSVTRSLRIENVGGPASVWVRTVSVIGPDAGSFSIHLPEPVDVGVDALDLPIDLLADRSGTLSAEVVFETDLSEQPTLRAALSASSIAPQACDLRMDRELIRFGLVEPSDPRRRSVEISNVGDEPCLIWGLGLVGDDAAAFAIDLSIPDVLFVAGHGLLRVPIRFASEDVQAGQQRMLYATLVFHSGSVGFERREVSVTAFQMTKMFAERPSHEPIEFEATPVGQASIVSSDFALKSQPGLTFFISDGSSPAFRLPASKNASGHFPVSRNQGGMGAPFDDTVWVAFVPGSEGIHRGQVELSMSFYPENYLIDLVGVGIPACTNCGWPSPSCTSAQNATVMEEVPVSAPGEATECNWSVGVPPKPSGGFRQRDRDFMMELSSSSSSCDGTFVGYIPGDYTLDNLEMRADGRGAFCQTTIHVSLPRGLWIEATYPRELSLPELSFFLLNGDGGDPMSKASWLDPAVSCSGRNDVSEESCEWDLPGGTDDPRIMAPQLALLPPVLAWVEQPSTLHSYSVGLMLSATRRPDAPDPIPSQVRVFCDGDLVSTMAPTFGYYTGDFVVVGTVEVSPSGACSFSEDGVTRWSNFWL